MTLDAADVPDLVAQMSATMRAKAEAAAHAWFSTALAKPLRADRIRTKLKKALVTFADSLIHHRTEGDLLTALLKVARFYGIRRIRYHFYAQRVTGADLVSIDSAGHGSDEAIRLRLGNISKCRTTCPPELFDSFLCIDRGWPVVFEIDSERSLPMMEGKPVGQLPFVVLARSQCDHVLADSPYRYRVDYPLMRGGVAVGKLSCDLSINQLSEGVARKLMHFWRLVLRTAAPLADLQSSRIAVLQPAADGIRDQLLQLSTIRALINYCVDELPKQFNILHASFFTVSTDATNSVRLILRRTSYLDSRSLEDGACDKFGRYGYYQISHQPDNAITAWVARTGRPIRLQHLNDSGLLVRQLRVVDPGLRWMNKIQDSGNHTSFLAVPIKACGKVVGVLRFTAKAAGDAQSYFTDIDEQCLARIASDHIGPRFVELQRNESRQLFCTADWQQPVVKALTETFRPVATSEKDRRRASFRLAMQQIFRESGQSRHLCLVNVPANAGQFTHLAAVGMLAPLIESRMNNTFNLEGTLTGRAIKDQRTIYVHDIDRAAKEGLIRSPLPETTSVLACPISLGSRGHGAIVLHSDRHDILPEVHGPLLEYLTNLTTEILTCRCRRYPE